VVLAAVECQGQRLGSALRRPRRQSRTPSLSPSRDGALQLLITRRSSSSLALHRSSGGYLRWSARSSIDITAGSECRTASYHTTGRRLPAVAGLARNWVSGLDAATHPLGAAIRLGRRGC